ncbi:hypothetical protein [Streptomyces sp. NPDC048603]
MTATRQPAEIPELDTVASRSGRAWQKRGKAVGKIPTRRQHLVYGMT